jgi:hypothetical protein
VELRGRGIVTLDYEVDFPDAPIHELSLYSSGATKFPLVLGESAPWGAVRRHGVLDIVETEYERVLDLLNLEALNSSRLDQLERQFLTALRELQDALGAARPHEGLPSAAHRSMEILMAFHVLNWAVPWNAVNELFGRLVGRRQGREALLQVLSPGQSHVFDELQGPSTVSRVAAAADDQERRRSAIQLTLWLHAASSGLAADVERVFRLLRLACTAEEERRRMQNIYLRKVGSSSTRMAGADH